MTEISSCQDVTPELASAIATYQAGDFSGAAVMFSAVLDRSPNDPAALRLRGLALVRAGDPTRALPLLAKARRLAFADPLSHLHYGVGLQEIGCHARAAALFRRAAMLAPREPSCWINLSASLLALAQPTAARAAARRAVTLGPRMAKAHYMLGMAETACGNPEGARTAFFTATRLWPGFADAWVNLGLACYKLGNVPGAMRAMHAARDAVPGHGAATANLAAFRIFRGESPQGLAELQELVSRDPGCIPGRLNLANALLLEGEPAEALSLLDGPPPPGRDGAYWRAQRAMAHLQLGQIEPGRAELDAIKDPYDAEILILWRRVFLAVQDGDQATAETLAERMAELADDEAAAFLEHRIIAHFELQGFHEARNRRARAFGHLQSGRRLLARVQPFSREHHAGFVAASVEAYSDDRLRNGPRADNTDPAPVFIVGMPRSGTTLAEHILAAHPLVHGAGERSNLNTMTHRLAGGATEAEWVHNLAALDSATLSGAAEGFLSELHSLAPGARRIVDKMPGNARLLGFAATLLPGARIIHCRRDPRDIALSIFKIRFFGFHPYAHDLGDLGWYIAQHEKLMAHWREVLPVPMIEVSLTDWVTNFSATLRRVLTFLDLPYSSKCANFHMQDRKVRTASARQVREPINARGIGRWRGYATELAPAIAELAAAGLVPVTEQGTVDESTGTRLD